MSTSTSPTPSAIVPEKSLLFIAPGVVIDGKVSLPNNAEARAVICGTLRGQVEWDGTVQVAPGGAIEATGSIVCRELVVAGTISGSGVRLETGLLRLEQTAHVSVDEANLPPGGLEQVRGATFNGKIVMSHDHRYSPSGETPPSISQNTTPLAETTVQPSSVAQATDSTSSETFPIATSTRFGGFASYTGGDQSGNET